MQLALNIVVFFLGFSLATLVAIRPKKARQDLEKFSANLRHATNGFKSGFLLSRHSESADVDDERSISTDAHNLLTK